MGTYNSSPKKIYSLGKKQKTILFEEEECVHVYFLGLSKCLSQTNAQIKFVD